MPQSRRFSRLWRRAVAVSAGCLLFAFSWLLRFNDPEGSFAGLTDDHFFYLIRGWQILFGDLPVRDFVDHGAPLYYYVAAAVQWIGGRGTLSEIVFSVTVLSAAAVLTYALALKASGSLVFAVLGTLFHILLKPRLYNYPKILVYAVAIPVLWAYADKPTTGRRVLIAAVTAVAFLFRHDHGVFVAAGFLALLLFLRELSWRQRLRHAALYAALVLVMLAPYALFVQANGGVVAYLTQASAWAQRDRARAPLVWPDPFENRADTSPEEQGIVERVAAPVRANALAWIFYLELALPLMAACVLLMSPNAFRPDWPNAAPKIATVIVIALALDAGFLRSPLGARLADPSMPHAVLIAWLGGALLAVLTRGRQVLRESLVRYRAPAAGLVALFLFATGFIFTAGLGSYVRDALENGYLSEGPSVAVRRARSTYDRIAGWWPLERWAKPEDSEPVHLAFYLRECTRPTDRIFTQDYIPQVLALAERAFAGGHSDLRPGFFRTDDAQQLTIARLERQSVPVVMLATGDSLRNFHESFPLVSAYLERHFVPAGDPQVEERYGVHLLVARDRTPTREYEPLHWPCFT